MDGNGAPVGDLREARAADAGGMADRLMIQRILMGDERGLAELYERHGRLAYALAYRVVGDGGTAEEVVQETFLAVWRRAAAYHSERGSVRTWLLAAVRHRAIDALRTRQARPRTAPFDAVRLAAVGDPAGQALAAITATAVRVAVVGLPPDQRAAVAMAYFGGYSYPEIAAALGVPLGTVKSRLRLALERLRRVLDTAVADAPPAG